MSTSATLDLETIAQDFATAFSGKLDPVQRAVAKAAILAPGSPATAGATSSYPAKGSIDGMIFYDRLQVSITDGKTFNGNAGGIGTPGGGALFGDVCTSDLGALYNNTVSFQFTATPVYFSIVFFDGNSNALGTFQAGALSTVLGTGGGSGSWT